MQLVSAVKISGAGRSAEAWSPAGSTSRPVEPSVHATSTTIGRRGGGGAVHLHVDPKLGGLHRLVGGGAVHRGRGRPDVDRQRPGCRARPRCPGCSPAR